MIKRLRKNGANDLIQTKTGQISKPPNKVWQIIQSPDMCFAWSILYDLSLCFLVYHNHPCCTHLLGEKRMNRNLLEYSMCFTYIF